MHFLKNQHLKMFKLTDRLVQWTVMSLPLCIPLDNSLSLLSLCTDVARNTMCERGWVGFSRPSERSCDSSSSL